MFILLPLVMAVAPTASGSWHMHLWFQGSRGQLGKLTLRRRGGGWGRAVRNPSQPLLADSGPRQPPLGQALGRQRPEVRN